MPRCRALVQVAVERGLQLQEREFAAAQNKQYDEAYNRFATLELQQVIQEGSWGLHSVFCCIAVTWLLSAAMTVISGAGAASAVIKQGPEQALH